MNTTNQRTLLRTSLYAPDDITVPAVYELTKAACKYCAIEVLHYVLNG